MNNLSRKISQGLPRRATNQSMLEHFNRMTSKEDFEWIRDKWFAACESENLRLHHHVVLEFKKRIDRCGPNGERAKLDFTNCGLDDRRLLLLIEVLAKKPVIYKLELDKNHITEDGIKMINKLLKGQLRLAKNFDLDRRLNAALLAEVSVANNRVDDSPLLAEMNKHLRLLKYCNAQAHVRSMFHASSPPEQLFYQFLVKMWMSIVGKLDTDSIHAAFEAAGLDEKGELSYEDLQAVLLQGLMQKEMLPMLSPEELEDIQEPEKSFSLRREDSWSPHTYNTRITSAFHIDVTALDNIDVLGDRYLANSSAHSSGSHIVDPPSSPSSACGTPLGSRRFSASFGKKFRQLTARSEDSDDLLGSDEEVVHIHDVDDLVLSGPGSRSPRKAFLRSPLSSHKIQSPRKTHSQSARKIAVVAALATREGAEAKDAQETEAEDEDKHHLAVSLVDTESSLTGVAEEEEDAWSESDPPMSHREMVEERCEEDSAGVDVQRPQAAEGLSISVGLSLQCNTSQATIPATSESATLTHLPFSPRAHSSARNTPRHSSQKATPLKPVAHAEPHNPLFTHHETESHSTHIEREVIKHEEIDNSHTHMHISRTASHSHLQTTAHTAFHAEPLSSSPPQSASLSSSDDSPSLRVDIAAVHLEEDGDALFELENPMLDSPQHPQTPTHAHTTLPRRLNTPRNILRAQRESQLCTPQSLLREKREREMAMQELENREGEEGDDEGGDEEEEGENDSEDEKVTETEAEKEAESVREQRELEEKEKERQRAAEEDERKREEDERNERERQERERERVAREEEALREQDRQREQEREQERERERERLRREEEERREREREIEREKEREREREKEMERAEAALSVSVVIIPQRDPRPQGSNERALDLAHSRTRADSHTDTDTDKSLLPSLRLTDYLDTRALFRLQVLILRDVSLSLPELLSLQLPRTLPLLTDLDVAHNLIAGKLEQDVFPAGLLRLDASFNQITDVTAIFQCVQLQRLDLSHNLLKTLYGLPTTLLTLHLHDNRLMAVASLRSLSICSLVESISIMNNPCTSQIPNIRVFLSALFRGLVEYDGIRCGAAKSNRAAAAKPTTTSNHPNNGANAAAGTTGTGKVKKPTATPTGTGMGAGRAAPPSPLSPSAVPLRGRASPLAKTKPPSLTQTNARTAAGHGKKPASSSSGASSAQKIASQSKSEQATSDAKRSQAYAEKQRALQRVREEQERREIQGERKKIVLQSEQVSKLTSRLTTVRKEKDREREREREKKEIALSRQRTTTKQAAPQRQLRSQSVMPVRNTPVVVPVPRSQSRPREKTREDLQTVVLHANTLTHAQPLTHTNAFSPSVGFSPSPTWPRPPLLVSVLNTASSSFRLENELASPSNAQAHTHAKANARTLVNQGGTQRGSVQFSPSPVKKSSVPLPVPPAPEGTLLVPGKAVVAEFVDSLQSELQLFATAFKLVHSLCDRDEPSAEDAAFAQKSFLRFTERDWKKTPDVVLRVLQGVDSLSLVEENHRVRMLQELLDKCAQLLLQVLTMLSLARQSGPRFADAMDLVMSSRLGQSVNEQVLAKFSCAYTSKRSSSAPLSAQSPLTKTPTPTQVHSQTHSHAHTPLKAVSSSSLSASTPSRTPESFVYKIREPELRATRTDSSEPSHSQMHTHSSVLQPTPTKDLSHVHTAWETTPTTRSAEKQRLQDREAAGIAEIVSPATSPLLSSSQTSDSAAPCAPTAPSLPVPSPATATADKNNDPMERMRSRVVQKFFPPKVANSLLAAEREKERNKDRENAQPMTLRGGQSTTLKTAMTASPQPASVDEKTTTTPTTTPLTTTVTLTVTTDSAGVNEEQSQLTLQERVKLFSREPAKLTSPLRGSAFSPLKSPARNADPAASFRRLEGEENGKLLSPRRTEHSVPSPLSSSVSVSASKDTNEGENIKTPTLALDRIRAKLHKPPVVETDQSEVDQSVDDKLRRVLLDASEVSPNGEASRSIGELKSPKTPLMSPSQGRHAFPKGEVIEPVQLQKLRRSVSGVIKTLSSPHSEPNDSVRRIVSINSLSRKNSAFFHDDNLLSPSVASVHTHAKVIGVEPGIVPDCFNAEEVPIAPDAGEEEIKEEKKEMKNEEQEEDWKKEQKKEDVVEEETRETFAHDEKVTAIYVGSSSGDDRLGVGEPVLSSAEDIPMDSGTPSPDIFAEWENPGIARIGTIDTVDDASTISNSSRLSARERLQARLRKNRSVSNT